MDEHDVTAFSPRPATELPHTAVDARPDWVRTPRGPRPARHVLFEVAFTSLLFAVGGGRLTIDLIWGNWAAWARSPARIGRPLPRRGLDRTICRARSLITSRSASTR